MSAQDPETPYETAETGIKTGRQGKLFFKLCDMRAATVLVNILNVLAISIGMVIHMIKYLGVMPLNAAIPAFVLSAIAIFGALNFELWAVAMAAVGFAVGLIVDLMWLNIFGIVTGCLVLYPTATMAHELYTGIMSKDTYLTREEYIDYDMIEKAGIDRSYIANYHEHLGISKPEASSSS